MKPDELRKLESRIYSTVETEPDSVTGSPIPKLYGMPAPLIRKISGTTKWTISALPEDWTTYESNFIPPNWIRET